MAELEHREFNCKYADGTVRRLSVRFPSKEEMKASDREYARVFNQCLLNGIPLRGKMLKEIRKNGLLSKAMEAEANERRNEFVALTQRMESLERQKPADDAAKAKQAQERQELEGKRQAAWRGLTDVREDVEAMLSQTTEAKADEAQRNYLICCVIEHVDGEQANERVWPDVDKLEDEIDMALVRRVVHEYMTFTSAMPSTWEEDEQKAAAEVAAEKQKEAAPARTIEAPPDQVTLTLEDTPASDIPAV